jgi:hypothetical protein
MRNIIPTPREKGRNRLSHNYNTRNPAADLRTITPGPVNRKAGDEGSPSPAFRFWRIFTKEL